MGSKTKFATPIDRMKDNFSGWSGIECETCGRETTKAQYSYSMRFFRKPLCRRCQSLDKCEANIYGYADVRCRDDLERAL
jgi:hypothetical protein